MNDEEQIRKLLAVYVQRTDDFDSKGKSELFTDDGRYCPSSGEVIGRDAIYEEIASRKATQPTDLQTKHLCGNSVISIAGDTAQAVTDYVVYRRVGDSPWEISQIGRYHDGFARRGDTWLFTENRPVKLGP
jgi:hypothetical protein